MQLLYWFSSLLPGLALLALCFPGEFRRGLLGLPAKAFVATSGALAPLCAAAWAGRWRVETFGWIWLALVCASAIVLARVLPRLAWRRALRLEPWTTLALLSTAVAASCWIGGDASHDFAMHAAKLRLILEQGFTLQDPHSPLHVVESKFHVNALHALAVVGCRWTGIAPLHFLSDSNGFFVLLAISALYVFARELCRSRRAALFAVAFGAAFSLSRMSAAIPNPIALLVVSPCLLIAILRVLERPTMRRWVWMGLAGASLGMIHVGSFALFFGCIVAALVLWWLVAGRERIPLTRIAAIVLVLCPSLGLVALTALQENHVMAQQGERWPFLLREIEIAGLELHLLDPLADRRLLPMLLAIALAFCTRKHGRGRPRLVVALVLVALGLMYFPPAFELSSRVLPYWILSRAMNFIVIAGFAAAGVLAQRWLAVRSRRRWRTALLLCTWLLLGCALVGKQRLNLPRHARIRQGWLECAANLDGALAGAWTGRPLVLADDPLSLLLPALVPCAVMAPQLSNTNPADGDLMRRHALREEFFDPATDEARRLAILRQERVDWIVLGSTPAKDFEADAKLEAFLERETQALVDARGVRAYRYFLRPR